MSGETMRSISNQASDNAPASLSSARDTIRNARELLEVVSEVCDGTLQDELNTPFTVLVQLLDLLEMWQQADPPVVDEAAALAEFIDAAVDVLRSSLSDASTPLQHVEQVTREAIDRWGEFLILSGESLFDSVAAEEAWRGSAPAHGDWSSQRERSNSAQELGKSPSQQEITELLAQLSKACVPASASPSESRSREGGVPAEPFGEPPAIEDAAVEMDEEFREAFLDDAGRCLSSIEAALLVLEDQPNSRAPLDQICRELHTLKGAAGSVGLVQLADDLHHLEDSLRDSQRIPAAVPSVEPLFARFDAIREQIERVAAVGQGTTAIVPQDPHPSLPQASRRETRGTKLPADGLPQPSALATSVSPASTIASFAEAPNEDETVRVKSSQLHRLMDMLAELVMLRNRRDSELSELAGIHNELLQSVSRLRAVGDRGESGDWRNHEAGDAGDPSRSLPGITEVATDILDTAQRLRDCYRPVAEGNRAVSQFIRQFRQELVELRRVPVSGLFRRLQRVASDAARAEQKQVRLRLIGEDAGIERAMQERLYEPLLHIIRNAVSHGIEASEERSRQGKDPLGVVTLEAQTSSDLLVLEIRDDGRGLNYDALRRRGIEQGLIEPAIAATREELAQLIFHPGFSTQQTASQISGRGVGMDVVAAAIARMRGWIEIDSTPGHGTTFRLTFPLPSVIQHTMVFRSSGQTFALPMQFVQAAGNSIDNVRAIPLATLFAAVDAAEDAAKPSQMLVLASHAVPSSSAVGAEPPQFALLVDEIVGPEEVVVRPIPPLLKHHPLCSGATLSGMGEVVLVLDHRRLMELIVRYDKPRPNHRPLLSHAKDAPRSELPSVLVVDDSLSGRKRLVQSLNRYGLDITEACDAAEASEFLQTRLFDAVFTDLEMPRRNGLELLEEIRARVTKHDLPVVIVSSRAEDEFLNRARQLGANAYLTKPFADAAMDNVLANFPKPIVRMGLQAVQ